MGGMIALAVRHVGSEDLGILAPVLAERGYRVEYRDAGVDPLGREALAGADLLVVLGGPVSAWEDDRYPFLRGELEVIEAALVAGVPVLGICLGAQLTARALGASVVPTGTWEIGYAPVRLTAAGEASPLAALALGERDAGGLPTTPVLHWHGDRFDVPEGAELLVRTETCEQQAFARGPRVLGLQFHLEADPRLIERWLVANALELGVRGIDPETIRRDAVRFGPDLVRAGRAALGAWLDGLDGLDGSGADAGPGGSGRPEEPGGPAGGVTL